MLAPTTIRVAGFQVRIGRLGQRLQGDLVSLRFDDPAQPVADLPGMAVNGRVDDEGSWPFMMFDRNVYVLFDSGQIRGNEP
jgi:hypothetical protein